MPNIIQQLRAEYEAATGGQWQSIGKSVCTVDTRASVGHAPNAYAGGVCNCLGDGMRDKANPVNVKARANAAHIVSAHNRMPLLLAALEAAVEYGNRRIEIQQWDVSDKEWPGALVKLRVAEIAMMSEIGKLLKEE